MSSFLHANLPSEDEEDDDYDFAQDNTAEKEDRPEGLQAKKKRGGIKRGRAPPQPDADERADGDEEVAADEDSEQEEAPQPLAEITKTLAKRAKIDAVWQALNSKDMGGPNAAAVRPSNSKSLAELCGKAEDKKLKSDLTWEQQLGLQSPQLQYKLFSDKAKEGPPQGDRVENSMGQRAIAAERAETGPSTAAAAAGAAAAAAGTEEAGTSGPQKQPVASEAARAAAAAALVAAKEAASLGVARSYNKVTVTETKRFAGQDIQVTTQVAKGSKEAAAMEKKSKKAPVSSGLDRFLAELEKKKKVNILDKSKMDWNQLKSSDTTMEEELEAHKRSSNKYLEKVEFLKKAELREYEIERDKRLQSDVRNRNRL